MKVIKLHEILSFFAILTIILFTSFAVLIITYQKLNWILQFDLLSAVIFSTYFFSTLLGAYYILIKALPIPKGPIPDDSKAEWIYHLHILFFFLFFHPFILSGLVPVPMRRKMYQTLGAKIGYNTYPAGTILDPQFVTMGDFCVVGLKSLICPHILLVGQMSHEPIVIGNKVTIAVGATIYGGTTIGDGALVLPHSVVNPNTKIGSNEVWGGVPAKKIKDRTSTNEASA